MIVMNDSALLLLNGEIRCWSILGLLGLTTRQWYLVNNPFHADGMSPEAEILSKKLIFGWEVKLLGQMWNLTDQYQQARRGLFIL